jgi:hypothetical protein
MESTKFKFQINKPLEGATNFDARHSNLNYTYGNQANMVIIIILKKQVPVAGTCFSRMTNHI